jgi:hypothetical protein
MSTNNYKFCVKRALKSKQPIKYRILAYVIFNEGKTSKEIARALHLKRSTVRSYLTKLFHEAEVDHNQLMRSRKEREWGIEREWNEQPSMISGLFMTKKEYSDFKKTDAYREHITDTHSPQLIHEIIMSIMRDKN